MLGGGPGNQTPLPREGLEPSEPHTEDGEGVTPAGLSFVRKMPRRQAEGCKAKQKVRKLENQDRTTENSEGRGQSQVRDGSQEV